MTIEATLTALIKPLNGNRIWWDTLPDGYIVVDPVVIAQQVGGDAFWYVDQTLPDHKHARIQLTVWAKTRAAANALSRLLEEQIAANVPNAQVYSAFTAVTEPDLNLYGNQQHFGFWYPHP